MLNLHWENSSKNSTLGRHQAQQSAKGHKGTKQIKPCFWILLRWFYRQEWEINTGRIEIGIMRFLLVALGASGTGGLIRLSGLQEEMLNLEHQPGHRGLGHGHVGITGPSPSQSSPWSTVPMKFQGWEGTGKVPESQDSIGTHPETAGRNKVTQFYFPLSQAAHGTRWEWDDL